MKSVLFFFCLIAVAVSAPTTPYPIGEANLERDGGTVVVDMPQRASLECASPDTWATLPNFDPPDEESPKPVLQVALN